MRASDRPSDEFVFILPHGVLTYYPKKRVFVADCDKHGRQPKCCRTRTANGAANGRGAQGRPLGFLLAYLEHHGGPEVATPEAHYKVAQSLTLAQRAAARAAFAAVPGSAAFLAQERPQREGEGAEPEKSVA